MTEAGSTPPATLISVVIPCLNEERRLRPTLQALAEQTAPPDTFEVIVVDGGSTDMTTDIARAAGARVVVSDRGHGRQRNAGAAVARGEWIAFLDADCTPAPGWLESIQEVARGGTLDVAGAPVCLPPGGTWVQRAWAAHLDVRRRQAACDPPDVHRYLTTANLAVAHSTFRRIGGFDPELASGEDYLFLTRARELRARIGCVPSLVVAHRGEPATLVQYARQQLWHSNRHAWSRIARSAHAGHAGNAPLFGLVTALGMFAILVSTGVAAYTGWWWCPGAVAAVHLALPAALALRTGLRAGAVRASPGLALLYWVYGLARAAHLLGLARLSEKRDRFQHAEATRA